MPLPDPAFTPITALPPAPSRLQAPDAFVAAADAHVAALTPMTEEINDFGTAMVVIAGVAEDAAVAAEASATAADGSAVAALASETAAALSADAAAASASAAAAASALTATSSTSMTLATGTKTLTLNEVDKEFPAGQWVYLVDPADGENRWLIGSISSFTPSNGNMTVEVMQASGTGTNANWRVNPSSPVYASSTFLSTAGGTLSGNLAVGSSLQSWNSNYKVVQTGDGGWIAGRVGTYGVEFGSNWFRNAGSNYERIALGSAGHYSIEGADHVWSSAASGAAGSTFTFTERMRLSSAGVLTVGGNAIWHAGNFTPSSKLDASANAVSATKLQTARLINGVAFDGTSDITISAGAGSFLPLTGGTLTGGLTGTTANFTSGLSMNGNAVWHAGNFTPSSYALLSSANFTTLQVGGNAVWHAGNLTPGNYALLTGATFTGAISSRGGDSSTPFATQNNAAANANQFVVVHNLSETQVGNMRGALSLLASGAVKWTMGTSGDVTHSGNQFSSGRLYGNSGSADGNGLGRVYLSTGAPSGGAQGDIWCVY